MKNKFRFRRLKNTDGGDGQGGGKPDDEIIADDKKPDEKPDDKQKGETAEQFQVRLDAALAKQKKEIEDEATRKAAEQQGDYKKLYEEIKPEYDELKTAKVPQLEKTVEDLKKVVEMALEARINALPEIVKNLNPKFADVVAQTAWLENAEKQAVEMAKEPGTPGMPPNPQPDGKKSKLEADKAATEAVMATSNYGSM